MERKQQDSQNLNIDSFNRPPVTSAQCIIGTEKSPDSTILLFYKDNNYSQGYSQIKKTFRAVAKGDILQPCKSDQDSASSNIDINFG